MGPGKKKKKLLKGKKFPASFSAFLVLGAKSSRTNKEEMSSASRKSFCGLSPKLNECSSFSLQNMKRDKI